MRTLILATLILVSGVGCRGSASSAVAAGVSVAPGGASDDSVPRPERTGPLSAAERRWLLRHPVWNTPGVAVHVVMARLYADTASRAYFRRLLSGAEVWPDEPEPFAVMWMLADIRDSLTPEIILPWLTPEVARGRTPHPARLPSSDSARTIGVAYLVTALTAGRWLSDSRVRQRLLELGRHSDPDVRRPVLFGLARASDTARAGELLREIAPETVPRSQCRALLRLLERPMTDSAQACAT